MNLKHYKQKHLVNLLSFFYNCQAKYYLCSQMTHNTEISKIYNEHSDSLYAFGRHMGFSEDTARDAIHDVFFKLCTSHELFKTISNVKSYLLRALKNRLIDIQRTNREYADTLLGETNTEDSLPFHFDINVEDELIEKEDLVEIQRKVENVLASLSDRQREIVYLRYIHEYNYDEIAFVMNISVESCRNLLSKSFNKLKNSTKASATILLIINT